MSPPHELLAVIAHSMAARGRLRSLCEDVAAVDRAETARAVETARRDLAAADHRVIVELCGWLGLDPAADGDSPSLATPPHLLEEGMPS